LRDDINIESIEGFAMRCLNPEKILSKTVWLILILFVLSPQPSHRASQIQPQQPKVKGEKSADWKRLAPCTGSYRMIQ
jgi:hypothetical protein